MWRAGAAPPACRASTSGRGTARPRPRRTSGCPWPAHRRSRRGSSNLTLARQQHALVGALHAQLGDLGGGRLGQDRRSRQQAAPASHSGPNSACRSVHASACFLQQRVIKTVVITCRLSGTALPFAPALGQQMAGRGPQNGVCVVRNKRLRSGASPSARKTEQVQYSSRPPGLSSGHSAASSLACMARQLRDVALAAQPAHVGMAPHDARGGARRVEQDGVEGLGRPTTCDGWPASAASTCACRPRRASVSWMRSQRAGSMSSAVTSCIGKLQQMRGLAARRGAGVEDRAAASCNRSPFSSSGAASCAAASCTDTTPSAKPGISCTGRGRARTMPCSPVGDASIPAARSRDRYCCGDDLPGVDAQASWAPGCCWPREWPASRAGGPCFSRSIHQRGWFHTACGSRSVAATSASRSRRKRRRQALMKLAWAAWQRRAWRLPRPGRPA